MKQTMKGFLVALMTTGIIAVAAYSQEPEQDERKKQKVCVTIAGCQNCVTYTQLQFPRGELVTVWEATQDCGSGPVVIAGGWY